MGDEDDRQPLLGETPDERKHLLGLDDAERRCRLVEEDDAGVPHHRPRDCDGLTLAARERRDRLLDRPQRRDAEAGHHLLGPFSHPRLVEKVQSGVQLSAEVHVLDDVQVVSQREVLIDDLDAEMNGVLRASYVDERPVEVDLAVVEGVDAGGALDQRRLPGAVVADERHDFAFSDLEVAVHERPHGAEELGDAAKLECGSLVHGRCAPYVAGQYFAYAPTQTWLFFRKPCLKRSA